MPTKKTTKKPVKKVARKPTASKKPSMPKYLGVIILILVFGVGLVFGGVWGKGTNSGTAIASADVPVDASADGVTKSVSKIVKDLYSDRSSDEVSFELFWEIWNTVKARHVDQEVTDEDLFYGALEGMVASLDDPYSVFLPPEPADNFIQSLEGEEFSGIGAEIGIRETLLTIIAPLPDSPAENAGIRAGDTVLSVDDEDMYGVSVEEAVKKIRGKKGTEVVLTVIHKGDNAPQDITIVRGDIKVPTILWEMLDDNIAHVRVSHFNQNTWREFDEVIKEVLRESPNGFILDMRNNPGGYLDTAIMVASEWVTEGVIVKEKLFDGTERIHNSSGRHRLKDIPTVVLINEGSASGSEIVAGALQDYAKATLVGATSFGKGSVQDFNVFDDESALKLTIAKWFTPLDRAIDKEGIVPDIEIEKQFVTKYEQETGEEPPDRQEDPENEGEYLEDDVDRELVDLVLEKATELLTK